MFSKAILSPMDDLTVLWLCITRKLSLSLSQFVGKELSSLHIAIIHEVKGLVGLMETENDAREKVRVVMVVFVAFCQNSKSERWAFCSLFCVCTFKIRSKMYVPIHFFS